MTRSEFISALRKELSKLPPEEIVAATEYFEEYFDDELSYGQKAEEEIVAELGSPKKVAAEIKADYAARILEDDGIDPGKGPSKGKKASAVWWIILGILAAPMSLTLAAAAFCVLLAVVLVVLAVYAIIIAVGVCAIAALVFGVFSLATSIATGLMFIGGALVLAALAAAAGMGAYYGTKKLISEIVKKIKNQHEKNRKKRLQKMYSAARGEEDFVERGAANV